MKANTPTSSTSSNLFPLRWNSFSQVGGSAYTAIGASFTPTTVSVIFEPAAGQLATKYKAFTYLFSIPSGALPEWIQVGTSIRIAASVTVGGVSYDISGGYEVAGVDPAGLYFYVNAPRPHAGRDSVAFTQTLVATALDSGSGAVATPLVSLFVQAQRAVCKASAGTVLIAPAVDHAGTASYAITLTGSTEQIIECPTGAKFDLSDWSVIKSTSGTLAVRFI